MESFLEKRVFPHPVRDQIMQILQSRGPTCDGIVRNFARRVAYLAAVGRSPELGPHVATVLRDVTDSPREYRARLWLAGITLSEDVVHVSDSLSFRRATRQDLQKRVRVEGVPSGPPDWQGRILFSCIAECKVVTPRPAELQTHVDRLITALRLFRLGSVSAARCDFQADSFSMFSNWRIGSPQRVTRLAYTMSADDGPRLLQATQSLMPLLPSAFQFPAIKPSFLSTALAWYSESLMAAGPVEGAVAWAVACLEALFLGDNPTTEISYRLTQRVIALLRCFGCAPLDVKQVVKAAYDVRSKHVHGATPKKPLSREKLGALHRNIAEYARVSCLVWTQLLTERKRNEVLATLEEALIDDASNKRLQQWCAKVDFAGKR
jgi:hypothetical protein